MKYMASVVHPDGRVRYALTGLLRTYRMSRSGSAGIAVMGDVDTISRRGLGYTSNVNLRDISFHAHTALM